MRLIDADELIRALQIDQEICFGCPEPEWFGELIQVVDNAPTVNAIPTEPRGTYQCFHCGAQSVVWQSDFSFEDYGIEGEGIIHVCHCANCGSDIEYYVPIGGDDD